MPVILKGEHRYVQRWKPSEDHTIIKAGKKYGKTIVLKFRNGHKERRWIVDWKKARKSGALKGLEKYTELQLSKRHSLLLRRSKKPLKKYHKRTIRAPYSYERYMRRKTIWDSLPEKIKRSYGWKPKSVWTEDQRELLRKIANSHRKSPKTIDWVGVMKDKRLSEIPKKFQRNLVHLRRYYWAVCKRDLQSHRASSLSWKKRNPEKYRRNQSRAVKIVREAVNDCLNRKRPSHV